MARNHDSHTKPWNQAPHTCIIYLCLHNLKFSIAKVTQNTTNPSEPGRFEWKLRNDAHLRSTHPSDNKATPSHRSLHMSGPKNVLHLAYNIVHVWEQCLNVCKALLSLCTSDRNLSLINSGHYGQMKLDFIEVGKTLVVFPSIHLWMLHIVSHMLSYEKRKKKQKKNMSKA